MNNNKKPSEPLEPERWTIFHYMCTHKPPWWLYFVPTIMHGTALIMSVLALTKK